jgi:hypothetical protein
MRMIQIDADMPRTGKLVAQPMLARHAPAFGGVLSGSRSVAWLLAAMGNRRALWSVIHLLGAGLFVLAMITRMAQAHSLSDHATGPMADGPAIFLNMERPLPSDPHMT